MTSISISSSKDDSKVPFQEKKIILIMSFTILLVVMNTTMFNVALPSIIKDFSLNSSTASWLVSGYSIMFAIASLAFSRLSDFIPISRLLFFAISILGIASIIGFFSNQYVLLLGVRIVQAAGGGGVMGLGMIMAGRYIPLSRRGRAMAIISSTASLAFGLGPVIGESLLNTWDGIIFSLSAAFRSSPFHSSNSCCRKKFFRHICSRVLVLHHFQRVPLTR